MYFSFPQFTMNGQSYEPEVLFVITRYVYYAYVVNKVLEHKLEEIGLVQASPMANQKQSSSNVIKAMEDPYPGKN